MNHDLPARCHPKHLGGDAVLRIGVRHMNGFVKRTVGFFGIQHVTPLRRPAIAFLLLVAQRIAA